MFKKSLCREACVDEGRSISSAELLRLGARGHLELSRISSRDDVRGMGGGGEMERERARKLPPLLSRREDRVRRGSAWLVGDGGGDACIMLALFFLVLF